MAKLSTKHSTQRTISYRDFSGGLNTTDATESIAQNELARAVNVCLDKSTGLLRTIQGTDEIYGDEDREFDVLMYDPWDGTFLVTDTEGSVYKVVHGEEVSLSKVGELTGDLSASYALWEDGMIIASGGKLQYYHDGALETLADSPANSMGVFVRDGRVWTWQNDRLFTSHVGDETSWEPDSEAADSGQWVDIGYKDRGAIKGVAALSSYVVIFKDNGHAYRLSGQFPDVSIKSVGRQLGIKNYQCCLSVGNVVLVLGDKRLQQVSVTDDYGEMEAATLSRKVETEVRQLSDDVRMRYVPTLNEVWFIEGAETEPPNQFMVYDVGRGAFLNRRYHSQVRDVVSAGEETYMLRRHKLVKESRDMKMEDEGEPLEWEFQTVTLVSYNQLVLKRVYVDTTPLFDNFNDQRFSFGAVTIMGSLPKTARYVWHNNGVLPHGRRYVCDLWLGLVLTDTADAVYHNDEHLWKKKTYCRSIKCFRAESRCVDRTKSVPVKARGIGGVTLFNQLAFDVAEV